MGRVAAGFLEHGRRPPAPVTRRAVAIAAATTLLIGAPAAGAPTWSLPVQVSSGNRALGPELAANGAGDALVVWDHEVGADCTRDPASTFCVHIVQLATRAAGSATWHGPIELSRPGVGAEPRGAVGAAGDAVVAWVHDIGDDRVLQATYRRGLAGSFPEPNDISEVVRVVRNHRVAVDGRGNAVVAWAERPPSDDVFVAKVAVRPASSGVWSAPAMLSNAAAGPELAVAPSGVALVAWIDTSGTVRVAAGNVEQATWTAPVGLANGARAAAGMHVAVNEAGEGAVVWVQDDATQVRAAYRTGAGAWSQPVSLGPFRAGSPAGPKVALDAGGAVAAWLSPGGVAAAHRSAAGTWRTSTIPIQGTSAPAVAVSASGNAVVAWTRANDGVVVASLRPLALGAWLPATFVSGTGSSRVDVVLDSAQRAVAVWNRAQGQRIAVEAADLAVRGPILAQLRLPARPLVAGAPRRFSVRPAAWAAPLVGGPRWTFGDGKRGTGLHVRHAYLRAGRYTVTATQADTTGAVSTVRGTVRVLAALQNRRRPWIQGTPRVGATLTCRRGRWTGSPPVQYAYRWRRDGRAIDGAASRLYRLRARDAGSVIACVVRATNPAGSRRAVSDPIAVQG